ncbi:hypothetical protein ECE50_017230 [Chitinophaga sp. Mgbs1]|uniref:Uncharacterized protein n=2 Tax=Chitinophaga solisilvae TaxID=1233460 RepID=A0A9Q5D0M0_9BACT|nr:hypothetical protein [Chitinophaga solisilvae]
MPKSKGKRGRPGGTTKKGADDDDDLGLDDDFKDMDLFNDRFDDDDDDF